MYFQTGYLGSRPGPRVVILEIGDTLRDRSGYERRISAQIHCGEQ